MSPALAELIRMLALAAVDDHLAGRPHATEQDDTEKNGHEHPASAQRDAADRTEQPRRAAR